MGSASSHATRLPGPHAALARERACTFPPNGACTVRTVGACADRTKSASHKSYAPIPVAIHPPLGRPRPGQHQLFNSHAAITFHSHARRPSRFVVHEPL